MLFSLHSFAHFDVIFFFLQKNCAYLSKCSSPSYKCNIKIQWPQANAYTILCTLLQKKLLSQMGINVGADGSTSDPTEFLHFGQSNNAVSRSPVVFRSNGTVLPFFYLCSIYSRNYILSSFFFQDCLG